MTFPERVALKAQTVRPVQVLLTILAAPFYVIGFLIGFIWAALVWLWAATTVGFADARSRGGAR